MKKILTKEELPSLDEVGFKVHSQFEEDGILLYIFSIIGHTNKKIVEICAGDGIECMATNLIVNHGWDALLFDGNIELVERGRQFFAQNRSTWINPPNFQQAWLTKDNINQLIEENGFKGDIDLLSLDVDGNDYHFMKAINIVSPRVIICETHNAVPGDQALTIPYKEDFNRFDSGNSDFMGVSLLAMKKLLEEKDYRLIGGHQYGFNAIFMRNDVGQDFFPKVEVNDVHQNSYTELRQKNDWNKVKDMPWMQV